MVYSSNKKGLPDYDDDEYGEVWAGASKYTTPSKHSCHYGNIMVCEVIRTSKEGEEESHLRVYGGGENRGGGWDMHATAPDVVVGPASLIGTSPMPQGWRVAKYYPTMIPIPWQDFGVPHLPKEFWVDLARDVMDRRDVHTLQVQCLGGHGRTGTALAILLGLWLQKWETVDDLVQWLRDRYCEEAVETDGQFEYIAKVTGLPWKEEVVPPKKSWVSYSSSSDKWENPPKDSPYDWIIKKSDGSVWGKYKGYNDSKGKWVTGAEEELDPLTLKKKQAKLLSERVDDEVEKMRDAQLLARIWCADVDYSAELKMYTLSWGDDYEEYFDDLDTLIAYLKQSDNEITNDEEED